MKVGELVYRHRLVALAMKYMVKTSNALQPDDRAECLVCGWSCQPGFVDKPIAGAGFYMMESHIRAHIERFEITEESIQKRLSDRGDS